LGGGPYTFQRDPKGFHSLKHVPTLVVTITICKSGKYQWGLKANCKRQSISCDSRQWNNRWRLGNTAITAEKQGFERDMLCFQ